ncbi:O-methylsterigmatocystin oxidoreductase [Hypsizygus marmoreus]|uniref:O-methylsterigmatocystin oxidoreductase n=1 Tax=Hypsizygus marmoreus TaxID=39966 RepID=A0A369J3H0_HYPMA|nr:O-methylsterigmatocystin oxidoreductase [Hypsizygus marmoreus]
MHPYVSATLTIAFFFIIQRLFASRNRVRLPPGPHRWPIIGNLLDMPRETPWLTFSEWGRKHGDISSITVLGQPVIILNSVKAATELLTNKGKIYSNRPELSPTGELIGWKNILPLLRIGESFKRYRKFWHQEFGTHLAMKKYHGIEETAMVKFLRDIGKSSQDLTSHIKTHIGAVTLGITFGFDVNGPDDPGVTGLDHAMQQFAIVTAPESFLVNLVPALRYIPSWLPGGGLFKKCAISVENLDMLGTAPYEAAKSQIDAGLTRDCLLSTIYRSDVSPDEAHIIKWATASIAAGGFSTRLSFFQVFFLLMSLNVDVQRRAQAEIDGVVGSGRLPNFKDRENLPYVDVLCREIFRFHAVVPTGLPHVALEDDIHDGYTIPKGSLIVANIWNMLHDPQSYADPDTFNPSRFISSEGHPAERDIYDFIFGFGRRVCPGRVLADTSLFIMVAMTLAVYDISKFVDENGVTVEPVLKPLTGSVSQPTPFKCSIKPRSPAAQALLISHADSEVDNA